MLYDYIIPCRTTIVLQSYVYRGSRRTTWEPYKHYSSIMKILTVWFSAPFFFVHIFNIHTQIRFSWKYRNLSKENVKRNSRMPLINNMMKGDEGWWRVELHPSPPETPINTGNSGGKMKGDEILWVPFLKKSWYSINTPIFPKCLLTALMCPGWSTKVPWLEHF